MIAADRIEGIAVGQKEMQKERGEEEKGRMMRKKRSKFTPHCFIALPPSSAE